MGSFIVIYALKVSVALMLFHLVYILFFRQDTFFKLRRGYFLFVLLFSLLYPLVHFELDQVENIPVTAPYMVNEIEIFADQQLNPQQEVGITEISWFSILIYLSLLGTVIFLLRFFMQLLSVSFLLKGKKWQRKEKYKLVKVEGDNLSSFSFFNWIVIHQSEQQKDKEYQDILNHECVHARQLHSIDVLLYEIFCAIFWWNPFAWLMKNEMKLNLEYLADEGVIKERKDYKDYQYALLKLGVSNREGVLISNFNVSHLKKRIIMMNKKRTSMFKSVKFLLAIPLALGLIAGNMACSSSEKKTEPQKEEIAITSEMKEKLSEEIKRETPKVFEIAEQMPRFPDGETEMMKFLGDNIKYPVKAQEAGIHGRVVVRFVVTPTGAIDDVKVMRGVDPELDEEAVRVVKSMPAWIPGVQNGEKVAVYYTLPVTFKLKTNSPKKTE